MPGLTHRGRARLAAARALHPWISLWSPAEAALDRVIRPIISRYASDLVIDIGCGEGPYRSSLVESGHQYFGSDLTLASDAVDFLADVCALPIARESVGTVVCSEVLEHVATPIVGLAELARILKPGGHLVLSVPFLARIHESPNDYFRFTEFALRKLIADAELDLVELRKSGAVFAFFGHQVASVVVPAAFGVNAWLGRAAVAACALIVTLPAIVLDRLPRLTTLFPAGYVVVARKPGTE